MKFEELENVWAAQSSGTTAPVDLSALKQNLMPEIKRRGRMLRYGIFVVALGLIGIPILTVANYRYALPANPAWHWVDAAFWMMANFTLLLFFVRELRRQRALLRQSADTVRALIVLSLTSLESEMKDYRRGLWGVAALIGFQLLSLSMKFPIAEHGWSPFALRAGAILGFSLLMSSVFWRHYRVNLKRDHARQQEILRELS
jgi:MFS family permease